MTERVAELLERMKVLESEFSSIRCDIRSLTEADFEEMVDAETLAPRLKITSKTLYELAGQGAVPSHKIGNSVRFVPREVFAASARQAR